VANYLKKMSTDLKQISTDKNKRYFFLVNRCEPSTPHPRGGRLALSEPEGDSPGVGVVILRQKRTAICKTKLKKAHKMVRWLRLIPTIQMIGVTGALAMQNTAKNDDIDLMFVVSPRRLWLSRGLIVLSLRLFGRYRRPGKIKDRFCPNLYLDEKHLALPAGERNLFTAHEVAQVKCLWDKGSTYQRFLHENEWVLGYLPNAFSQYQKSKIKNQDVIKESKFCILFCHFAFCTLILDFFEKLAYKLQLIYMRSKRTREIVESGRAFFHPRDQGKEILLKYHQRLTEFGITT
jgi:hypothetical protein